MTPSDQAASRSRFRDGIRATQLALQLALRPKIFTNCCVMNVFSGCSMRTSLRAGGHHDVDQVSAPVVTC